MKNKLFLLLCAALALASCTSKELSGGMKGQDYLSTLDGPKVEGVEATLLKNAADAETAGNFALANTYYQQLIEKNPQNAEYKSKMGDALRRSGQIEQSLPAYDAALAQTPSLASAKEGKGLAFLQKGDFDNAKLMLNDVKASGQAGWRTYNALGLIAASRETPASARPLFDEALRLSPNNPSILNNLGLSQAMGKDFDGAIASLTQASALSTPKPESRKQIDLNTALVYASAGKLENAEAIARQYFDGPALNNNLGFYAYMANDEQLAKTYLNMALTQSKTFYQRAWKNLEAVQANGQSGSPRTVSIAPPAAIPAAAPLADIKEPEKKEAEKKAEPVSKSIIPATTGYLTLPNSPTPAEPLSAPAAAPVAIAPAATTPEESPAMPPARVTVGAGTPYVPPPAPTTAPASQATTTKKSKNDADNGFEALGSWVGSILD